MIDITLLSDVIERCREHGHKMAKKLDEKKDIGNVRSAALSSHGAEKDPVLLGRSKMAECVFCQWRGIDINKLNWTAIPDKGFDVVWRSIRVDVKHSSHDDPRYCIWPINKTSLFDSRQFDIIVHVFGIEPTLTLQGWITKPDFRRWRKIAKNTFGLADGTRYVDTERLEPIETLEQFVLIHRPRAISGVVNASEHQR